MQTEIQTDKDLVFVVSGGRTGTRFLGEKISSAIDWSFSEHEPDLIYLRDLRSRKRLRDLGLWNGIVGKLTGHAGIRSIGTLRLKGRISRPSAIDRIIKIRAAYHKNIDQPLIIESNSQWHLACDQISEIWPKAKIAIIIRDPRTWIRSWLNKGTRWSFTDLPRWVPPGRLTPRSTGDDQWKHKWRKFGIFGRLAWEWRFVYSRLDEHAQNNQNAQVFRFEDLFAHGDQSQINNLLLFCAQHEQKTYQVKIPSQFTSRRINESKGPEMDWNRWSDERCRLVNELCGPLMQKYGYGNEPHWNKRIYK